MHFTEIFIRRPVATTLLTLALFLAGAFAFPLLPVAPLPQAHFPTISHHRDGRARPDGTAGPARRHPPGDRVGGRHRPHTHHSRLAA